MVVIPPSRNPAQLVSIGDRGRIVIMGLLLGLVLFLFFLPTRTGVNPNLPPINRQPVNVEAFRPDGLTLAKVKDATASDRSVIDADAMQHLLKLALNVTPDIAEALKMPDQQIPVDVLRYLWFKGKLDYFEPIQTKHPIHGYKIYEGHLWIPRQDQKPPDAVFFFVSKPAVEIKAGDFVRIEGYFLKLRDEHLLAKAERGPLLIGSKLKPAHPDWKAIDKLDHSVLARVQNPIWKNETWINDRDAWLGLPESENVPLWHLASYAMHQSSRITEEQKRQVPYFVDDKMLAEFKHGSRDQGTPVRIKGRFAYSRIVKADVNPVGIDHWSVVWVQLPRLGGKSVPVWVTKDIGDTWRRLQDVELLGYYFKNFHYRSLNERELFTPLFVAADIKPITLPTNPLNSVLAYCFMAIVMLLIVVIFVMYRTNVKQTRKHEGELVDRRRRRRNRHMQEASGQV
jgi:hypothetical protein